MRRTSAPLLILLLLVLALPAGSSLAASRGAALDALLNSVEDWSSVGANQGGRYGHSVAVAGDINNDGYDDIIVGAPLYSPEGISEKVGGAIIYFGSSVGIQEITPAPITLISKKGSEFGTSVSRAGDVNGDGYADIIIGAPSYKEGGDIGNFGAAFVYYGSDYGFKTVFWQYKSDMVASEFGYSVAGVGDVNGDGFDDVLVGARTYDAPGSGGIVDNAGAIFLFTGSAEGLSASPAWSYTGTYISENLGSSVSGLGDLNQDGFDDFLAGAPNSLLPYYPYYKTGAAFIWYGVASLGEISDPRSVNGRQDDEKFGWSVSAAGDVDGNGLIDVIIGAKDYRSGPYSWPGAAYVFSNFGGVLQTTPSRLLIGQQDGSDFGYSVAGLGDLNDDGYADVGVGAPECDGLTDNEAGCVYVYCGSSYGLAPFASWEAQGGKADTEFGMGLGGAGDINGDGYGDLIVGAPIYRWNDLPVGKAIVFHGASFEGPTIYRSLLPLVLR